MITCPNCGATYPPSVRLCPKDGTVLEGHQPTEERFVGAVLHGKYRLDSYLSSGGMGAVFRATHVMLGKPVAVKLIKADLVTSPDMVRRFQREARAATSLNHPNIVGVYDLGQTDDGTLYIAMELVDGKSLKDLIKETGRIDPARIVHLLRQVASALALAHRHHIIHRDLKPQNVMITRDPDGREVAKLLDFGIAKTFDEGGTHLTQTGFALGTPQYMAPEQAMGKEVDGRSDLYALGVMMYEMLIGEVPFTDPSAPAILVKHMMETPAPPSHRRPDLGIPAHLEAVVLKCLEKDPASRYQTAEAFIVALESGAGTQPAAAAPIVAPVAHYTPTVLVPPPAYDGTTAPTVPMAAAGSHPTEEPPTVTAAAAGANIPLPATIVAPTVPTASAPPVGAPSASVAPPPPASMAAPAHSLDTRPTAPAAVSAPAAATTAKPSRSYAGLGVVALIMVLVGAAGAGAWYLMKPAGPTQTGDAAPPDAAPASALPPPAADAAPAEPTPSTESAPPPSTSASVGSAEPPSTSASARPAPAGAGRGRPSDSVEPPRTAAPGGGPPAQTERPQPAAPEQPAAAVMPANPSVFIDCRGAAEICSAVRSAFDQLLERDNLPIARSSDRADIVLLATVSLQSERHDQQFGTSFVVRTYAIDVTADAPKVDRALAMGSPRTFSFDARYGQNVANENARAVANDAVRRIRAFADKR